MDQVGGDVSAFLRPGLSLFSPTCHDDDEDVRMGMAWSGVAKGVAKSAPKRGLEPPEQGISNTPASRLAGCAG